MRLGVPFRTALMTAGLLAPLLAPGAARAQVGSDQAQQLESQLRDWLAGLVGPNVPLGDHPVRVTPEGDHYRLAIEYAGAYGPGVSVTGDPLTALIKPLDANRWAIDEVRIPSPLRVDNHDSSGGLPKSYAFKLAEQTTKGVVDLSFATTSSFDTTFRGYTSVSEMASGSQTTHIDHYTSHTAWQPTGGGRLNMLASGHGEQIASEATLPDGSGFKLTANGFDLTAHADGVAPDKMRAVIKAGTDLIPIAKAAAEAKKAPDAPKPEGLPPEARASLHAMVASLRDALGGLEEEYSFTGLAVQASGHSGTLAKWTMGLGFGAPGGRADIHMLMAMDGLDSPEIPPGVYHDFLPKHIMIKPRVSGVPMDDLVAFLNHAIDSDDSNSDELQAEAMGLLAKGPLLVGLDDLALDAGPATLKGSGSLSIVDPMTYSGQAEIRATGFDALIQKSNTTPELKQAGPVLIFLKGIGKQDGNAMVWDIAYQDKKLTVNGTDLSSMVPGNDAQPANP